MEEAFAKLDDATSLSTIDEKNLISEGISLQTSHFQEVLHLYIYIYISYFNYGFSSHLKLATRLVHLNLLKFFSHALEIANQASNTMKHKPLV